MDPRRGAKKLNGRIICLCHDCVKVPVQANVNSSSHCFILLIHQEIYVSHLFLTRLPYEKDFKKRELNYHLATIFSWIGCSFNLVSLYFSDSALSH